MHPLGDAIEKNLSEKSSLELGPSAMRWANTPSAQNSGNGQIIDPLYEHIIRKRQRTNSEATIQQSLQEMQLLSQQANGPSIQQTRVSTEVPDIGSLSSPHVMQQLSLQSFYYYATPLTLSYITTDYTPPAQNNVNSSNGQIILFTTMYKFRNNNSSTTSTVIARNATIISAS